MLMLMTRFHIVGAAQKWGLKVPPNCLMIGKVKLGYYIRVRLPERSSESVGHKFVSVGKIPISFLEVYVHLVEIRRDEECNRLRQKKRRGMAVIIIPTLLHSICVHHFVWEALISLSGGK